MFHDAFCRISSRWNENWNWNRHCKWPRYRIWLLVHSCRHWHVHWDSDGRYDRKTWAFGLRWLVTRMGAARNSLGVHERFGHGCLVLHFNNFQIFHHRILFQRQILMACEPKSYTVSHFHLKTGIVLEQQCN